MVSLRRPVQVPLFARVNPLDGTSATIALAASVDDAVAAVAAAAAAFREWSLKGLANAVSC